MGQIKNIKLHIVTDIKSITYIITTQQKRKQNQQQKPKMSPTIPFLPTHLLREAQMNRMEGKAGRIVISWNQFARNLKDAFHLYSAEKQAELQQAFDQSVRFVRKTLPVKQTICAPLLQLRLRTNNYRTRGFAQSQLHRPTDVGSCVVPVLSASLLIGIRLPVVGHPRSNPLPRTLPASRPLPRLSSSQPQTSQWHPRVHVVRWMGEPVHRDLPTPTTHSTAVVRRFRRF